MQQPLRLGFLETTLRLKPTTFQGGRGEGGGGGGGEQMQTPPLHADESGNYVDELVDMTASITALSFYCTSCLVNHTAAAAVQPLGLRWPVNGRLVSPRTSEEDVQVTYLLH